MGQAPGLSNRLLGQTLGEENHQLSIAEMPNHNHKLVDPGHSHSLKSLGTPVLNADPFDTVPHGSGGFYQDHGMIRSATTGITIESEGGGAAHNVMQPSTVVNFLIKS